MAERTLVKKTDVETSIHVMRKSARLPTLVEIGRLVNNDRRMANFHALMYSDKWILSEKKNMQIGKSGIIEARYEIDGIRRIADLNCLGLSQYIGEKNFAFFFSQNPLYGKNVYFVNENGEKITKKIEAGETIAIMVEDKSSIEAIAEIYAGGRQISPIQHMKIVGEQYSEGGKLSWHLNENGASMRLLARYTYFANSHRVDADSPGMFLFEE